MLRNSETRHIDNKRRWNEDKCRCQCKELIDKGMYDKGFVWHPSNCEWECDKSCDVREYLDYKNCMCIKRIIDKLVEKDSENIDGNEMLYNETLDVISLNAIPLNVYKKVRGSCTLYIVPFAVFFITSICISSVFIYFHWYFKKENIRIKFYPCTQTTI